MTIIFYIAALVAILSTLLVITRTSAVHALLYLIVSLLAVAMIFFVLGAPFVAALEVIIYAGAIMVLFIFVIMMLNLGGAHAKEEALLLTPGIWKGPAILCMILAMELIYTFTLDRAKLSTITEITPKQVGTALLGSYVLGVELASMLLLAGLVGAYHLGRPHRH